MTSLILPAGIKPGPLWKRRQKSPAFWKDARKKFSWRRDAASRQPLEYPGRKIGKPEGSHIHDLVGLKKAIILCWRCQPKFDHKKADYYKDQRFPTVIGKCDGCRTWNNTDTKIYIHNSFLGEPNGRTMAGQVWTPR